MNRQNDTKLKDWFFAFLVQNAQITKQRPGQLHLQRVVLGMGGIAGDHLRQVGQRIERGAVQWNAAQRRGEGLHRRRRQPLHGDAVAGAEQHDATDASGQRGEQGVSLAGGAAGIDVAGVWHDDRLEQSRRSRRRLDGEAGGEIVAQAGGIAGVEAAGDGRRSGGGGSGHMGPRANCCTEQAVTPAKAGVQCRDSPGFRRSPE